MTNDGDAPDPEFQPAHMTPDAFRRHGRDVIEWIARYMESVESYPVRSSVEPGEIRAQLPPSPPSAGEPFEAILADIDRVVMPGITHWQSPSFFAYFPSNNSGPSILGELLSAGLGVQGMLWATSPACTEIETHVLDWLVELLGLPDAFRSSGGGGGVIQDTASSATLCAILAARERATGLESNRAGVDGSLVAYASTEAHFLVEKAVRIAGIGADKLRRVEVDRDFAMRPEALERAIVEDVEAGLTPFFVNATVGTTASNALDPLAPIGELTRRYGAWLHVDAAMSGTAAVCPELRSIHDGIEYADSYCVNPHKWMFTNFDCDAFFVADRGALIDALAIEAEYLKTRPAESGEVIDYRDWHVPLGRRFRALKLWFVIRHYGVEGLQRHIRRHVALAQQFAGRVDGHPAFELAAPVPLNLVCFRHVGGDAVSRAIVDRLNDSGRLFLTHSSLDDRFTLRFCVGQAHTDARHVDAAWEALCEAAEACA